MTTNRLSYGTADRTLLYGDTLQVHLPAALAAAIIRKAATRLLLPYDVCRHCDALPASPDLAGSVSGWRDVTEILKH
jgi:hypothetical protein